MAGARRLLVAGAGFLGVELMRQAQAAGWEVLGLRRSVGEVKKARVEPAGKGGSWSEGGKSSLDLLEPRRDASGCRQDAGSPQGGNDGGLSWVAGDLGDLDSLRRVAEAVGGLGEQDWVVHCASSGRGGVESYQRVYRRGCEHLLAAFPGVPLGFTSSTSVFGQVEGEWVTEESAAVGATETARVLLAAEEIMRQAGGAVLRLAGLYGPGRSVLLQRMLEGTAVMEPEPSRWINQIQVADAAAAWLTILNEDPAAVAGRVLLGADGTPMRQREIQEWLARHLGRPLPPEGLPDPGRKRGLTSKRIEPRALRALGWVPRWESFPAAVAGGGV